MSKCLGCGLNIQDEDVLALGYAPNIDNDYCQRCFKIQNYNYHDDIKVISNKEIINLINEKKAMTFFLCDFLSFNQKNIDLYNEIKTDKVFVLTKSDMLPKNLKEANLINRLKDKYNIDKVLLASIITDDGINEIVNIIQEYKTILFAGPSSSGKSSLINYLFNKNLTTSSYQNTTQMINTINEMGITIYDVPGFSDQYYDLKYKGSINSKTIILKSEYELLIDEYIIQTEKDTPITMYIARDLSYVTRKIKTKNNNKLNVPNSSDITIKNGCLLYFKNQASVLVNKTDGLDIHNSIVGGL